LGYISGLVVLAWKLGRRRRFVIITLLIMGLVALFAFAPAEYSTRVASVFDSSRDKMGSIFSRKALLLRSLEMAVKHPLLGIGMGNFRIVSHNGQVNHNAYLQVATEMGMTAMVIYIMFIVAPLRRLRAVELETWKPRHRPRVYYMAVGLQASLISFMVSSLFSSVAYLWFIYYLVGYAVCLRRLYDADRAASTETSEAASDGVKRGPGGRERAAAVLNTS
jgi:O-antigen ligase